MRDNRDIVERLEYPAAYVNKARLMREAAEVIRELRDALPHDARNVIPFHKAGERE